VHPFASQSEKEWILRVQSAEPDLDGLPLDLDTVIRATLARDAGDRPNARELVTLCQARTRPVPLPRRCADGLQVLAA
jgi:hypothetical protein